MLADPLILKDSAGVDVTFNLVSSTTDPKTGKVITKRTDASREPTEPRVLEIQQSVTGLGSNRVRRTQVRLSDTQISTLGVPYTMSYQGSWVFPLNGEFTSTNLDDAVINVSDLLLSTSSLAVDATKRADLLQGQA